ncbi:hypothetical protein BB561_005317 [Smittium simulii]|uniref:Uncharacterized protein n=1 Tax=Smittium simulii TaxID=133385 RepID=A0A2T9YB02_9FUNG|nr:hypothetical protein BB561_005317 [Smittium simulii]
MFQVPHQHTKPRYYPNTQSSTKSSVNRVYKDENKGGPRNFKVSKPLFNNSGSTTGPNQLPVQRILKSGEKTGTLFLGHNEQLSPKPQSAKPNRSPNSSKKNVFPVNQSQASKTNNSIHSQSTKKSVTFAPKPRKSNEKFATFLDSQPVFLETLPTTAPSAVLARNPSPKTPKRVVNKSFKLEDSARKPKSAEPSFASHVSANLAQRHYAGAIFNNSSPDASSLPPPVFSSTSVSEDSTPNPAKNLSSIFQTLVAINSQLNNQALKPNSSNISNNQIHFNDSAIISMRNQIDIKHEIFSSSNRSHAMPNTQSVFS